MPDDPDIETEIQPSQEPEDMIAEPLRTARGTSKLPALEKHAPTDARFDDRGDTVDYRSDSDLFEQRSEILTQVDPPDEFAAVTIDYRLEDASRESRTALDPTTIHDALGDEPTAPRDEIVDELSSYAVIVDDPRHADEPTRFERPGSERAANRDTPRPSDRASNTPLDHRAEPTRFDRPVSERAAKRETPTARPSDRPVSERAAKRDTPTSRPSDRASNSPIDHRAEPTRFDRPVSERAAKCGTPTARPPDRPVSERAAKRDAPTSRPTDRASNTPRLDRPVSERAARRDAPTSRPTDRASNTPGFDRPVSERAARRDAPTSRPSDRPVSERAVKRDTPTSRPSDRASNTPNFDRPVSERAAKHEETGFDRPVSERAAKRDSRPPDRVSNSPVDHRAEPARCERSGSPDHEANRDADLALAATVEVRAESDSELDHAADELVSALERGLGVVVVDRRSRSDSSELELDDNVDSLLGSLERELRATGTLSFTTCEALRTDHRLRGLESCLAFLRVTVFAGDANIQPIGRRRRVQTCRLLLLSIAAHTDTPRWSSFQLEQMFEAALSIPGAELSDLVQALFALLVDSRGAASTVQARFIRELAAHVTGKRRRGHSADDFVWIAVRLADPLFPATEAQAFLSAHVLPRRLRAAAHDTITGAVRSSALADEVAELLAHPP